MNTGNWKITFSLFFKKGFNCLFLYKRASIFQIFSVSTETSKETTSAMRRLEKSYFYEFM